MFVFPKGGEQTAIQYYSSLVLWILIVDFWFKHCLLSYFKSYKAVHKILIDFLSGLPFFEMIYQHMCSWKQYLGMCIIELFFFLLFENTVEMLLSKF